tara:strand:- start:50 stop:325 length:276 start_codon:yes stop_codon:yes gene_type:complete
MKEQKKMSGTRKRFEAHMIALYGAERLSARRTNSDQGDPSNGVNLTLYYDNKADPEVEAFPGAGYGHVGTWQKGGGWYYEPNKKANEEVKA